MRRDEPLRVKQTVCFRGKPLLCFENLPGFDAEMAPAQVRALAAALLAAAEECESLQAHTRRYGPARQEYPLGTATVPTALPTTHHD